MNWLQLIERRISVRQYEEVVAEATLARVGQICEHINSLASPEVVFRPLPPGQGRVRIPLGRVPAPRYIAAVSSGQQEALSDLGDRGQRLVLHLTSAGLGTCWQGFLPDRQALGQGLELEDGRSVYALLAWGLSRPGPSKTRRRLPPEKIAYFAEGNDPRYPWRTVLEAVRWAPSALNRQPWRLWFGAEGIHLYARPGFIARSYTPIEMGIARCHLELACRQLAIAGQLMTAPHPSPQGWQYWVSYLFT